MFLPSTPTPPARRRRGTAVPWLIIALFAIIFIQLLTLKTISLNHRKQELQQGADAAALAAARALVDEELLTDHDNRRQTVKQRAADSALRFARLNKVDGQPLALDYRPDDYAASELVFGNLNDSRSKNFLADPKLLPDLDPTALNTARVKVIRRGAAAAATAHVRRDVLGFKPQGKAPLPVVPLAVRAAWWDQQLAQRNNQWFRDPRTRQPVKVSDQKAGDDRIPEVTVCFQAGDTDDSGRVLQVGNVAPGDTAGRQTLNGIARADLRPLGGRLTLGQGPSQNLLLLPRQPLSGNDLATLQQSLLALRATGERRVWMLYSPDLDADANPPSGTKRTGVVGFVAAQVMDVQLDKDTGRLCVVLQPGMRITVTALTDATRRTLGPRSLFNPYVCRVGLTE